MEHAVEASGIEKAFARKRSARELFTRPLHRVGKLEALRGVDLAIERGETFGLLGPNGAGKTTLLKIFSCLILPDRGRARIGGEDTAHENRVKPLIGLVHSDERSFYWRLSGRENLSFFARLYNVPGARIRSRIDELLERVDMKEAADRRFSDYSSGMKQRLAIARALLHDPPILLMDEPTKSLDPVASLALREFVRDELKGRAGKTILLATHNLREAEALCDRVAVLVRGKIREIGTISEVRRWGVQDVRYRLEVSGWTEALRKRFELVSDESAGSARCIVVSLPSGRPLDELLRASLDAEIEILSCERLEPDLEDAFARILKSEPAEGSA